MCCRAAYDYLVAKQDITQLIQCGPACLAVALHSSAKDFCLTVQPPWVSMTSWLGISPCRERHSSSRNHAAHVWHSSSNRHLSCGQQF